MLCLFGCCNCHVVVQGIVTTILFRRYLILTGGDAFTFSPKTGKVQIPLLNLIRPTILLIVRTLPFSRTYLSNSRIWNSILLQL